MNAQLKTLNAQLAGRTIKEVRFLDEAEQMDLFGTTFDEPTLHILLDDGSDFVVLADPEGNGPGWIDVSC